MPKNRQYRLLGQVSKFGRGQLLAAVTKELLKGRKFESAWEMEKKKKKKIRNLEFSFLFFKLKTAWF